MVTGGSQGVGRAIAETLAERGPVIVLDVVSARDWDHRSVQLVTGDASDPDAAVSAALAAEEQAPLLGWVTMRPSSGI